MSQTLTIEDVLALIKEEAESLDDATIYYALRQYKYKPILRSTLPFVKLCVAIDGLGLIITSRLLESFYGGDTLRRLHNLGDKHVLTLKRKLGQHALEWLVHPAFKKILRATQHDD